MFKMHEHIWTVLFPTVRLTQNVLAKNRPMAFAQAARNSSFPDDAQRKLEMPGQ